LVDAGHVTSKHGKGDGVHGVTQRHVVTWHQPEFEKNTDLKFVTKKSQS
jgi:hypothetical protein